MKQVKTGITSMNRLHSWVYDDMWNQGIDLTTESILNDITNEVNSDETINEDDREDEIEKRMESIEIDEREFLFGDWKKDESGKYIPDENGKNGFSAHYSNFCGGTISVEYSKHITNCHYTSPCFVMADGSGYCGDLDTKGDSITAYTLPDEYFRNENEGE